MSTSTEYTVTVAVAQESILQPGRWNALALWPEARRMNTFDTRAEAEQCAAKFRDRVMMALRRSRMLREGGV